MADAILVKTNKNWIILQLSMHELFTQMTKTKWQFIARINDVQNQKLASCEKRVEAEEEQEGEQKTNAQ